MDSETKFYLALWLAIIASLTAIIMCGILAGVGYNKTALEKGYVEQQIQGSHQTMWVKPK